MSSLEQEIKNFLLKVGLPQYSNKLINEDVTMTILEQMTHDDLKSVGISSFGHRFSIMKGLESYSRDSIEDNPVLEEGTTVQVLEEGTSSQVSQDDPNITEDVDTLGVDQEGNNDDNQQVIFRSQSLETGRVTHHVYVDFYRFDRNTVKVNGRAYFLCNYPGCGARLVAVYSSRENKNNEEPVVEDQSLPPVSAHKVNGVHHPIQLGLRMVEKCRTNIKEAIKDDPLRPVMEVYEEQYSLIKESIESSERDEFVNNAWSQGDGKVLLYLESICFAHCSCHTKRNRCHN